MKRCSEFQLGTVPLIPDGGRNGGTGSSRSALKQRWLMERDTIFHSQHQGSDIDGERNRRRLDGSSEPAATTIDEPAQASSLHATFSIWLRGVALAGKALTLLIAVRRRDLGDRAALGSDSPTLATREQHLDHDHDLPDGLPDPAHPEPRDARGWSSAGGTDHRGDVARRTTWRLPRILSEEDLKSCTRLPQGAGDDTLDHLEQRRGRIKRASCGRRDGMPYGCTSSVNQSVGSSWPSPLPWPCGRPRRRRPRTDSRARYC